MYFRKCWRDSRIPLLFYGILTVFGSLVAVLAQGAVFDFRTHSWHVVPGGTIPRITQMWNGGLTVLAVLAILLGVMTGLGLGASGAGSEFPRGSLEFLFTRPRARRYFLWTGWLAGISQLLVMYCLNTLVAVLAFLYICGGLRTWRIILLVPLAVTSGAVTYGLTCFLTVLCRDGRLGMNLSLGLVGAWIAATIYLRAYHQINIPFLWNMLMDFPGRDSQGVLYGNVQFPLWRVILWWVLALALPAAAQPILEKSDA